MRLEINSIGDPDERKAYRVALVAHFELHARTLDDDARRRLHTNPLRILDSKNAALREVIGAAPRLLDSLKGASREHFEALRQALADYGIPYTVNPRLVRGLDYYNRTVFEWISERLGAQGTVAGGGRYDGLFEQLGGKPTPACGFAIGIERVILLLRESGRESAGAPDAFVVHVGDAATKFALATAERLRDAGLAIVVNASGGSFKSQMKRADASGARWALIVGEDEVVAKRVALKPLRVPGEQIALAPEEIASHLQAGPI